MERRNMVRELSKFACPVCWHSRYIIYSHEANIFLTNNDGEIVDSKEYLSLYNGKCLNCGNETEMYRTNQGFIPLTHTRKILLLQPQQNTKINMVTKNPMFLESVK